MTTPDICERLLDGRYPCHLKTRQEAAAEIERLRLELADTEDAYKKAYASVNRLAELNEMLRTALCPFAAFAEALSEHVPDQALTYARGKGDNEKKLSFGHFRAAARAMRSES